jgi:hypothetical protein
MPNNPHKLRLVSAFLASVIPLVSQSAVASWQHGLEKVGDLSPALKMQLEHAASGSGPAEASDLPQAWESVARRRAELTGRPVGEFRERLLAQFRKNVSRQPASAGRGVPIVSVGNDPACDYTASMDNDGAGLQQAITDAESDANGPALTEIRLANTGYFNGRTYEFGPGIPQEVTLRGGYATCDGEEAESQTTIDAQGVGSVFLFADVGATQSVYLSNLVVTGGDSADGGGLRILNNNFVSLTNTHIESNLAGEGAGVYVQDTDDETGTLLWVFDGSTITMNTADANGGGVLCTGTDASVTFDSMVAINDNAAFSGGGLSAENECSMASYAGFPGGIFANDATNWGGGVRVLSGADFSLIGGSDDFFGFGDAAVRTTLDNNIAGDQGGGLYVNGQFSSASAMDSWIVENQVASGARDEAVVGITAGGGAGVAIENGGSFQMDRTLPGDECHTTLRCSSLSDNTAPGSVALMMVNPGTAEISQTWIENNTSNDSSGLESIISTGHFGDTPSVLSMEGNVIAGSAIESGPLIWVRSNSEVQLGFVTIADNLLGAETRVFQLSDSTGDGIQVDLYSSVVWEEVGEVFMAIWSPGVGGTVDCSFVHETESLPSVPPSVSVQDPLFEESGMPGLSSYELTEASPAIDYCDTALYEPTNPDIEGDPRGQDAGAASEYGPYDLGAHEFDGLIDGIFTDRFDA